MILNNVKTWIDDLLDPNLDLVFDMQYDCIRRNGKIRGDAAAFLVYRFADLPSGDTAEILLEWYDENHIDLDLHLQEWTGIPLDDMDQLIRPNGISTESITAEDFVKVLKNYMKTKLVEWDLVLAV